MVRSAVKASLRGRGDGKTRGKRDRDAPRADLIVVGAAAAVVALSGVGGLLPRASLHPCST